MVTIPNNKLDDIQKEEEKVADAIKNGKSINYFWCVSKRPKNLHIGDKVYFIWNKAMRGYHKVVGFDTNMKCTTTGNQYKGCCIILDPIFHDIEYPIPMNGFRGFRYVK
ncbi:MAG: DUF1489 family protein [Candidatus Lokiarchaeota archaeon]|nr:DUF1489 family protein [Candidatus Lokiarchaeota archaeon]